MNAAAKRYVLFQWFAAAALAQELMGGAEQKPRSGYVVHPRRDLYIREGYRGPWQRGHVITLAAAQLAPDVRTLFDKEVLCSGA